MLKSENAALECSIPDITDGSSSEAGLWRRLLCVTTQCHVEQQTERANNKLDVCVMDSNSSPVANRIPNL